MVEDVSERADRAGIDVTTAVTEGTPARTIVQEADDDDVIVMGTHGRTGPDRLANLGSTTERVVKNGDVPVLVVDID